MRFLQNNKRLFIILIFAAIPVVSAILMCIFQGIKISDIYLPASQWCDEILYYKQVEDITAFGKIMGYYGSNESFARIGGGSFWNPTLWFWWVIWGKVFGWNILSPIWANICLITITFIFFAILIKADISETFKTVILIILFAPFTKYMLSVMPESIPCAFAIIYAGFVIRVKKNIGSFSKNLIGMNIVLFFLISMRPYYIALGVIPILFIIEQKFKKVFLFFESIFMFFSLGIYFLINKLFCSAYIAPLFDISIIKNIFISPTEGIFNLVVKLATNTKSAFQYAGSAFVEGSRVGGWYAVFFILFIWFIYKLLKKHDKKLWTSLIIVWTLVFGAIMLFYDVNVGSRHLMVFDLIGILLLSNCTLFDKNESIIPFVIGLFVMTWIFFVRDNDYYESALPKYSDEYNVIDENASVLSEKIEVDVEGDRWDNTLIWTGGMRWNELYSVPSGIAINMCGGDYVISNFNSLKSKYLAVEKNSEINLMCESSDKELLLSDEFVNMWKLR